MVVLSQIMHGYFAPTRSDKNGMRNILSHVNQMHTTIFTLAAVDTNIS